jgi:hypothetical protein
MSTTHGFQNESLLVRTKNGEDDKLVEPLVFFARDGTHYRAPEDSTTDGLSTPKIIRLLPGYDSTGDDWWSGVLHDAAYRDFLEIESPDGVWKKVHLTQAQSDALILDAMGTQSVGWPRRHIIYYALRMFGSAAFKNDRMKHGSSA